MRRRDMTETSARSPQDLISELDAAAQEHEHAVIAVPLSSEEEAAYVTIRAADPDRLQRLERVMARGGMPLGLILLDRVEGRLTAKTQLYPDWPAAFAAVAALWHLEPQYSTPVETVKERAESILHSMAETVVYDLDWDTPYRQDIDKAVAEAHQAGFVHPLDVVIQ